MAFSWNPFKNRQQQTENNEINSRNPTYNTFKSVDNDIERIVAQRSVINNQLEEAPIYSNPIWQTYGINSDMLLMPVATNKSSRLAQYYSMSKFTECGWCLDEICDEFIHENENGDFITLTLPDGKSNINETRKKVLQEQFKHYINLFRFRDEGYDLVRRFLIEGELAWENIIDPKRPDIGIKGVKFLPAEYYETLVDTKSNRAVGIVFDIEKLKQDIRETISSAYLGSSGIFNRFSPAAVSLTINKNTCIPFLWPQVTYISSGQTSRDGLVVYPLLENTKQAYHQLALLQEAAIILRVTRAPERLLFNVSTGRMNQAQADEWLRNFANSLKAKKVAKQDGSGDIASTYNPVSMLESYIFGKSSDSDGTSVESVGSSANYEELGDIEFFLRRYMKQFKVPFSRYKTPENAPPTPDQLNYEEYAFLRMIIRFQRRFANGFKNGFITHLKLRDIWDKYDLKDEDIDVAFVKPSMYEQLAIQQLVNAKMETYKASLGDDNEFSKITAMKKYLGFTDAEVRENYENLIKEKMLTELSEYYGGKVAENEGLEGWTNPIPFKKKTEDEGGSEGESNDDSGSDDSSSSSDDSGSDDSGAEAAEAPEKPEDTAPPSFGLG